MKNHALLAVGVMVFLLSTLISSSLGQDSEFLCQVPSAFGERTGADAYTLDLLCQPVFPATFEIDPRDKITVTVNLKNYYDATGTTRADFEIHLAMQRARIEIIKPGDFSGREIVDFDGAIQDLEISTSDESLTFEVRNKGARSAIFDLSVRPIQQ